MGGIGVESGEGIGVEGDARRKAGAEARSAAWRRKGAASSARPVRIASVIPGSLIEWPALSTTAMRAAGQASARRAEVAGGQRRS